MKKTFFVLALFLGLMCVFLFSEIPREITVGLNEPYPPYTIIDNSGKIYGIFPEIIEEAAKIVKIYVEYKQFHWVRMTQEAKKGDIDAVMGLFRTPDREKHFEFSDEGLVYEEYSFFTLKGSGVKYSGKLDELKNITIGVVQDYKYGSKFDNADFLKTEKCLTDENLIEKLVKKRFKIALGSKTVIDYYAIKLGVIGKIKWLKPPVSTEYSHVIAFSKAKKEQSKELALKFSDAIEKLIKNGRFKEILDKYNFDNKENFRVNKPISIDNPERGDK